LINLNGKLFILLQGVCWKYVIVSTSEVSECLVQTLLNKGK